MSHYLKRSGRFVATLFCCLAITQITQAASFDCGKARSKVEHIICDDAEISKLDDELSAAYKAALQDVRQIASIKQAQKRWMKGRSGCKDADCVKQTYETRLLSLTEGKAGSPAADSFKGEYILMRAWPDEKVCQRFKDNLNRFRKLDFDQCNPRLSDKFPEFSRPYQWEEILFDMALAEKAIRSTTDYDSHEASASGLEYMLKLSDKHWQQWRDGIEPFRAAGTARMWTTKIDIDGDGVEDTLLRMMPGGRSPIDSERPSRWTCDYNIGELYVIEAGSPPMAAAFNKSAWYASDIIQFSGNNHFYLLSWDAAASTDLQGWFNQPVPSVGGTRGVTVSYLYRGKEDWKNNYSGSTPSLACLIDWMPTGRYIPAAKSKSKSKYTPDTH